ncbi:hypothetical protein D3C75_1268070 [compost metagenome]
MPRAVSHIGDLIAIRTLFRHNFIKQIANGMHHFKVLLLIMAANVVGLTHNASRHHGI